MHDSPHMVAIASHKSLPPDTPLANWLRGNLLLWGAIRQWPAIPASQLPHGGEPWSDWLFAADVAQLGRALQNAYAMTKREEQDRAEQERYDND